MTRIVWIDGTPRSAERAVVSVFDRGFLYGDSVFEVLRTWNMKPVALEEHLGRLSRSAIRLGIAQSVPLGRWKDETLAALSSVGPEAGEQVIRWVLTRGEGDGGLDGLATGLPTRVMMLEPLRAPPHSLYRDGVRLMTLPRGAMGPLTLLGAKTGNYLLNIMALRHARASGAYDGIFVRSDGAVQECASANLFAYTEGRWITASLSDSVLPGITRGLILDAGRASGVRMDETTVTESDLWTSDEVFVCSSVREIVPVVQIDDHEVGSGVPGPHTRHLHRALRALISGPAVMPWE